MRILVADDDRVWVTMLEAAFKARGFEVVTALDGAQATRHVFQGAPDLVVLDVQMPGGTGIDALKRLKMSTKTSRIPVLVVSGSTDASMPVTLADLGAAEFIAKPASPDAVCDAAARLLSTPRRAAS